MKTPKDTGGAEAMGKKARDLERKIQKGFNVTKVDEGQMNKFAAMMKGRKGGKGGGKGGAMVKIALEVGTYLPFFSRSKFCLLSG